MKVNTGALYAVIVSPALFFIDFIPLAITALVFVIFTLASIAERIKKDEKVLLQNKYIFVSIIYLLIFLLIWAFFLQHKLPFFFATK
jgi:multisubunit Na+/H+ antiporter MnhB subunit